MAHRRDLGAVMDIVTVFHNDRNHREALDLQETLRTYINGGIITFTAIDNTTVNRGFSAGCNLGARLGTAPIIGFLNPDVSVHGPFIETVQHALVPPVVITGNRYGKPSREIQIWGCNDWVCGASFFVDRAWFESRGGFDRRYEWGWEETDLIRQAQDDAKLVVSLALPIAHCSPSDDSPKDIEYKQKWFDLGAKRFRAKWHTGA